MNPQNSYRVRIRVRVRVRRSEIRWTADEYTLLAQRAKKAGMSVSDYVRNAALEVQPVFRQDRSVVLELRRIGALIKHNYPKVKSWSDQERKRYWQTREQLLKYADQIAKKIGLKTKGERK